MRDPEALGGMTKGAFIAFPGFSVNTLTLFGLVLAVGIIVDDAIVISLSLSSKPYIIISSTASVDLQIFSLT
jgi:hypothetical protein